MEALVFAVAVLSSPPASGICTIRVVCGTAVSKRALGLEKHVGAENNDTTTDDTVGCESA